MASGNDEAELELSVESRSFVNRVNDQVRKRQKRISVVTDDGEKHSGEPRLYVCQAPGALIRVSTCGVLHDTFWVHLGPYPKKIILGFILGPFGKILILI